MNNNIPLTMLMILDGFGLNPKINGNAIAQANTPNLDKIFEKYPATSLKASGEAVGLPNGQMGNSEVGHLNIGAGRIVYQELSNITNKIKSGDFFKNPALIKAIEHAKNNKSSLHIMGLLSDGGVHSHINHLFALLDMAKIMNLQDVFIHCFFDGRDVPPKSAINYMQELEEYISKNKIGKIATCSGRYYAMDRDKRWDRVNLAYDAMTNSTGEIASSGKIALENSYEKNETDEFVRPTVIYNKPISDNDSIIMFNFRPDRAREITRAFVDKDFQGFNRKKILKNLCYVCMTQYDSTIENVEIAFPPESIKNTLGEHISNLNLKQLRIAETEKYAHVTFFFNGGVEKPNKCEDRILVPSPKVATYDLKPEMSAHEVTEKVINAINSDKYNLIILNYANADMVGHTGVFDAAVKAIETLDTCVEKVKTAVLSKNGQILLTADHGNADVMISDDGNIMTAHTTNPVPLVHISNEPHNLKSGGKLSDIAPTLLKLMNLDKPKEMTGNSLV